MAASAEADPWSIPWFRVGRCCSKACYIILKIIIHGCNDAVDQNNVVAAGISSQAIALLQVSHFVRAAALGTARKCAEAGVATLCGMSPMTMCGRVQC